MPEYLAPSVFVEETSFRNKSIEGVGTSTAGFVGAAKKGPLIETPELLTSFAEFERMFGSLPELDFDLDAPNYLAHAVMAFFNEGGSRLYVSRAITRDAATAGLTVRSAPSVAGRVNFLARTPGSGGNGVITVTLNSAPASRKQIERAPDGTLLKANIDATPAELVGGVAPFRLTQGGVLRLKVDNANAVEIPFTDIAVAAAQAALTDPVNISAGNVSMSVAIDGIVQQVPLPPSGSVSLATLITTLNKSIQNASFHLSAAADGGAVNRLILTRTAAPHAGAKVHVSQDNELGFTADVDSSPVVADITNVSVAEINSALVNAGVSARAGVDVNGRLVLRSLLTSVNHALALAEDPQRPSIHAALGLVPGSSSKGTGLQPVQYFTKQGNTYLDNSTPPVAFNVASLEGNAPVKSAILTVSISAADVDGQSVPYVNLGLSTNHPRYIGAVLSPTPGHRSDALLNAFAISIGPDVDAPTLLDTLLGGATMNQFTLTGGSDGSIPGGPDIANALKAFDSLEDLSIVAAPGNYTGDNAQAVHDALIAHVEQPRMYRIAVLDSPQAQINGDVIDTRSKIDSTRAALYTPWVVVPNPLATSGDASEPKEIALPPSGFVAGIYARTDDERGVFKAPANEIVRAALRFERDINFHQQEQLNPLGINCLRYLSGRGFRVWGARTATSDPEWKYVNVRRYFNYVESSVDRGTQWAVFEPNGPRLWTNIRDGIIDFLTSEWRSGALMGNKPEDAFFVRCDRTTMTQNDLDNGRLICLVGIAVQYPAEFVIIRIGQTTADAKN